MVITGLVIMDLVIMGTGCRVTGIGHGLIGVGTTARIPGTGGTVVKHQTQAAGVDILKKKAGSEMILPSFI